MPQTRDDLPPNVVSMHGESSQAAFYTPWAS